MPDVFISYSITDEKFAQFLHRHLADEGLDAFLASISLEPGKLWTPQIFSALKNASWVLFLGSRAACVSPYVQQELGAALITEKKLVPIIWDMPPSQLPGWLNQYQAVNLSGTTTIEQVRAKMSEVAERIKADKCKSQLIGGLLLAGLAFLATR